MTDLSKIKEHWQRDDVASMYDKHYAAAEVSIILPHIPGSARVLDAGCGEGEGTLGIASVPGACVCGCDYSATRLKKAAERLRDCRNVELRQVDFLQDFSHIGDDFDRIVTQRFLINIPTWEGQSDVLLRLMDRLRPGGKLLMLEGYRQGAEELNQLRRLFGLEPVPVLWHNKYIDDDLLVPLMTQHGYALEHEDGLGAYMFLTRGIRPCFEAQLDWDCAFNQASASCEIRDLLRMGARFSRVKLWVFAKGEADSDG